MNHNFVNFHAVAKVEIYFMNLGFNGGIILF